MGHEDDVLAPFLLMRAFRGLVDSVHRQLAAQGFPGLRAQHGFALQAIAEGCTSVELGRRLGVSKQAAAKTARALAEMGLTRVERNEHDRRERVITVSVRGQRMLQLSAAAFRRELASWRSLAGDDAVTTTLGVLAAVGSAERGDTDVVDGDIGPA